MNYEVAALRSLFIADRFFLGIGFCHFEYDVQYLSFYNDLHIYSS